MTEGFEPRTLVVVRHGQTAWNQLGRGQGHVDVELDETGHGQASSVAPALAAMEPVRLWTSDLSRARQTMAYLEQRTGLTAEVDPRLREYDLGVRSGLTFAEFAERFPAEYDAWLRDDDSLLVRGAESHAQVRARVAEALHEFLEALAPGETGIVVMHGAAVMVGLAGLFGWPDEVRRTLRGMDNCAWAVVNEHPHQGGLRLAAYNATAGKLPALTEAERADFASGVPVG